MIHSMLRMKNDKFGYILFHYTKKRAVTHSAASPIDSVTLGKVILFYFLEN